MHEAVHLGAIERTRIALAPAETRCKFCNAPFTGAIAHVFRLKPAPDGRDYQIWALVDGKPVSLSVFNSDADGRALVQEFTLPGTIAGVSAVLVSVEPKGGSVQPTTTPFLAGNFSGS